MVKCRQAMENPTDCGKVCCCFECEDKERCPDVCGNVGVIENYASDCEDAFCEENQMVMFQSAVLTVTQTIANIAKEKARLEDEDKKMREELEKAMGAYGVTTFENEFVKITHVDPTTKTSVDSKKLKKELPDIYQQYSKTSDVKGYVKISVK